MKAKILPKKQTKVSASSSGTVENSSTSGMATKIPTSPLSDNINNIASLKAADVQVKEIKANGSIVLSAKVSIDINSAIRSNVNNVTLSIVSPSSDVSSVSTITSTPSSKIDDILNSSTNLKVETQKRAENIAKSINIDITAEANNKNASLIGRTNENIFSQTEVSLKTISVSTAESANEYPILQTPTSDGNKRMLKSETSLKQLFMDTILKDSLSISHASKENIPFSSTEESVNGLVKRSTRHEIKESKSLNSSTSPDEIRQSAISGRLLGGKTNDVTGADDFTKSKNNRSNVASIPVLGRADVKRKTIEKEIIVTAAELTKLGSNLNFIVESVGENGVKSKPAGCKVDISEKISKFNFNEKVGTRETRSGNSFSLSTPKSTKKADDDNKTARGTTNLRSHSASQKLKDEEDKKVNFGTSSPSHVAGGGKLQDVVSYEKIINPFLSPADAEWKEIRAHAVDDRNEIKNTTTPAGVPKIVRHVNLGFSPAPPRFSEAMIPSVTRHLATTNSLMGNVVAEVDNRFVSITTFLIPGGIQIRLSEFQSSYSIGVWRRDASIHEKNFSCIKIKESIIKVDESTPEALFVDTLVKEDHVYEYRTKIFTREGREIFGSNMSRIMFRYINDNAATIKITKTNTLIDESGNLDVTFGITADLTDTNVSTLVDILKSQGNDKYFTDDLTANRERLKNMIAYQIDRHDLTLGIVESYALFKGGTFSDVEQQSKNAVQPLRTNHTYRYVISLLSRDADALIPSVTRQTPTIKNTPFAQQSSLYNIRPSKSLHPMTLKKSILRSESTIAKSNIEAEFMDGFTGMQAFTEVSIKAEKPKIVNGSCIRTSSGACEIRWNVTGQINKFDHFIITAEQLGMTSIIGKSHAFSHNNSYIFEDKMLSNTVGDVIYFIIPVYNDFTVGENYRLGISTSMN
jgi:hypothetical protein